VENLGFSVERQSRDSMFVYA